MDFNIRHAERKDILHLLRKRNWQGVNVGELTKFISKYFDGSGKQLSIHTGHPDTVLVVFSGRRIIGYIHYWTDCWEGYEKYLVGLAVDPKVLGGDAEAVRKQLMTGMEEDY